MGPSASTYMAPRVPAGFEPLSDAFAPGGPGPAAVFADLLSPRDSELIEDPRFASALTATIREALRPGTSGGGWDNGSWVGAWDVDLSAIRCPVLLWYGTDDRFAPPAHGRWL